MITSPEDADTETLAAGPVIGTSGVTFCPGYLLHGCLSLTGPPAPAPMRLIALVNPAADEKLLIACQSHFHQLPHTAGHTVADEGTGSERLKHCSGCAGQVVVGWSCWICCCPSPRWIRKRNRDIEYGYGDHHPPQCQGWVAGC